jgi:hypothetical protein
MLVMLVMIVMVVMIVMIVKNKIKIIDNLMINMFKKILIIFIYSALRNFFYGIIDSHIYMNIF